MIPAAELAEAVAETNLEMDGTPATARFMVLHNGYPLRFCLNPCGYWGNAATEAQATRFDSIHDAGAACRRARLTGLVRIVPTAP